MFQSFSGWWNIHWNVLVLFWCPVSTDAFSFDVFFSRFFSASLSLGQVRVLYVSSIAYAWSRLGACRCEEGELCRCTVCNINQPKGLEIVRINPRGLELGDCLRIFEEVDGNFSCYCVYLRYRGLVVYAENKTRKMDFQTMVGTRCIMTPRCLSHVLLIIHSCTYPSHVIPIAELCLWNVPPQRWSYNCHRQCSLHPWKRQPGT